MAALWTLHTKVHVYTIIYRHFTLYALKCKKVKLIVAKWGVNKLPPHKN